ncbi:MAG: serine hydrolase domain-containing protein [Gaiellales bacterium]
MTDIARIADGIDRLVAEVLGCGVTPAAAVAVTDRDSTLFSRTYGDAAGDALWQTGSIGKSFTAALALDLAARGELDLHAPVTGYLPWFSVRSEYAPITPHHLLTHTAGLICGSEIATASTYDVVELASTDAAYAPGEHYWYSNVGYRAMGLVLERVTGTSYPSLVQSELLDRLSMRDSTPRIVHETRSRLPEGHTALYDDRPWRPEHGLVPATWIESAEADGCICSSIADLAAWLRALWRGDVPAMRERLALDEEDGRHYGYGLIVAEGGFGHTGSMIGFQAMMWADERSGLGAVACVNGLSGARALVDGALAIARGEQPEPFSWPVEQPLEDDGTASAADSSLIGHYRSHNPWLPNFRVAARDGGLVFGSDCGYSERYPLAPLGNGEFRVGEQTWSPERLRFDSIIDGTAQRAFLSGAAYHRTFTP